LKDIINNSFKENRPIYIFTHQGKIQETIHFLRENCGIENPILLSNTSFELAKIYQKNKIQLGDFYEFNDCSLYLNPEKNNYLAFIDSRNIKNERRFIVKNCTKITLSGWIFDKPSIKIGKNHFSIALSAHAGFNELMHYIKSCGSKLVITDNYRFGSAMTLSKQIEKELKIKSLPRPKK